MLSIAIVLVLFESNSTASNNKRYNRYSERTTLESRRNAIE